MTQEAAILADLRAGKRLTPLGALRAHGCLRLGARIYDLRQAGYPIVKRMVEHPRTGKRYAEYRLESSGTGASK